MDIDDWCVYHCDDFNTYSLYSDIYYKNGIHIEICYTIYEYSNGQITIYDSLDNSYGDVPEMTLEEAKQFCRKQLDDELRHLINALNEVRAEL